MLDNSFEVFLSENVKVRNVKVVGGGGEMSDMLTHRLKYFSKSSHP